MPVSNTHQVMYKILGSGSILEALHLGKLLLVVPNSSLMDNHQAEVAKALSEEGYLLESSPEYWKNIECGLMVVNYREPLRP